MPFIAAVAVDRTGQNGTRIAAIATLFTSLDGEHWSGHASNFLRIPAGGAGLTSLPLEKSVRVRIERACGNAWAGSGAVLVVVSLQCQLGGSDDCRHCARSVVIGGSVGSFRALAGRWFVPARRSLAWNRSNALAAFPHPYGAHPHSWPIQISAEYGLPAALLLTYCLAAFRGVVRRSIALERYRGTGERARYWLSRRGSLWLGRRKLSDAPFPSAMAIAFGCCLALQASSASRHTPKWRDMDVFSRPVQLRLPSPRRCIWSVILGRRTRLSKALTAAITVSASGSRACLCR